MSWINKHVHSIFSEDYDDRIDVWWVDDVTGVVMIRDWTNDDASFAVYNVDLENRTVNHGAGYRSAADAKKEFNRRIEVEMDNQ